MVASYSGSAGNQRWPLTSRLPLSCSHPIVLLCWSEWLGLRGCPWLHLPTRTMLCQKFCCLFRQRGAERKLSSLQSWPTYLKDEANGGKFSSSLSMQFEVVKEKEKHTWKILSALNLFSQTCVCNNGHFWPNIPVKCFTFSFFHQNMRMRMMKNLRQINVTNEAEPLCACMEYSQTHTHTPLW